MISDRGGDACPMPPWPGPVPVPHAHPWGCGGLGAPASEARPLEQSVLPGWCKWGPPAQLFLLGNHPVHIPIQHNGRILSSLLCTGSKEWGGRQGKPTAGCWSCVGRRWARVAAPQPLPCPRTGASAPPQPLSARFSFQGSVASGDLALLASSQVSMDKDCPQCSVPGEPPQGLRVAHPHQL